MDQDQFDHFTKTLATERSRRSVLRSIGATIAAGLAGLWAGEVTAHHRDGHGGGPKGGRPRPGRCGRAGHPCKWGTHCCSGDCLNRVCTACPTDSPNLCPGTEGCHPACPEGKVFNPETCTCECVEANCCRCEGDVVTDPTCVSWVSDFETCSQMCNAANNGGSYSVFFGEGIGHGRAFTCSTTGCEVTCDDNL